MGLTNDNIVRSIFGNKRVVIFDCDLDSSYVTNGESLTPADLGLTKIDIFIATDKNGYSFEYDYTNKKLKVKNVGAHTHTENTAGSYTQNATTAASTAVPEAEVANGVDLSGVTNIRCIAIGY